VHRERGGDPAETLVSDGPLLVTVTCWALYCGAILYTLG
jgi:hypothetical protein